MDFFRRCRIRDDVKLQTEVLGTLRELLPDQDFTTSTPADLQQRLDDWGWAYEMHSQQYGWTVQIYRHWSSGGDLYAQSYRARTALLQAFVWAIETPEDDEDEEPFNGGIPGPVTAARAVTVDDDKNDQPCAVERPAGGPLRAQAAHHD